ALQDRGACGRTARHRRYRDLRAGPGSLAPTRARQRPSPNSGKRPAPRRPALRAVRLFDDPGPYQARQSPLPLLHLHQRPEARLARFLALALRLEAQLRQGVLKDNAEVARVGHVTRARVSQIVTLVHLAPDIQEAILFLPRTQRGRDPVILSDVIPIAMELDWKRQRRAWRRLMGTL